MFTGIIQDIGTITSLTAVGGDNRIEITARHLQLAGTRLGDSIAVSGVCLTVAACTEHAFSADVSRETLRMTTLGKLTAGSRVNLESALRAGDSLGGHLVSGHVDGIGTVTSVASDARSLRVNLRVTAALARYIAVKGSVAVDGVSLTVNQLEAEEFALNLVPHTQSVTTLGELAVGHEVNIEIDLVARYVARLLGKE